VQSQRGAVRKQLSAHVQRCFNSAEAQIMAATRNAGIVQTMDLGGPRRSHGQLEVVLREWSAPGAPISVDVPQRAARLAQDSGCSPTLPRSCCCSTGDA